MTPESCPKLREEIQFFFAEDEAIPFVFVRDPDGYVRGVDRLHRSALQLLQPCDGEQPLSEVAKVAGEVPMADLLGFMAQLDAALLFEGDRLDTAKQERADWLASTMSHVPVCRVDEITRGKST